MSAKARAQDAQDAAEAEALCDQIRGDVLLVLVGYQAARAHEPRFVRFACAHAIGKVLEEVLTEALTNDADPDHVRTFGGAIVARLERLLCPPHGADVNFVATPGGRRH